MQNQVRVTNTRSISGNPITVASLKLLIAGAADECVVRISHYDGDQREPGYDTLTIDLTSGGQR